MSGGGPVLRDAVRGGAGVAGLACRQVQDRRVAPVQHSDEDNKQEEAQQRTWAETCGVVSAGMIRKVFLFSALLTRDVENFALLPI